MNTASQPDFSNQRSMLRLPKIWMALIVFDAFVVAMACAQNNPQTDSAPPTLVTQIEAPADAEADGVRFEAIDVFVDSGNASLAAYQLEVDSASVGVEIVGIEGGDHAAFKEPPYYDPAAMKGNRVILAAFSVGKDLPVGRSRVARIHLQLEGRDAKEYRTKLSVSADADGELIPAEIEIEKAKA